MTYKGYTHRHTHTCISTIVSYHYQSERLFLYEHLKCGKITVCDKFWLFGVIFGWLWMVVGGCGGGCGWLWIVVDGCGWLWMVFWVVVGGRGWLWLVVGG